MSATRSHDPQPLPTVGDGPETVDHPKHYNSSPSGVEAIDVIEHMPFNVGTAMKYLWRCGFKGDAVEDLKKAAWYVAREIAKREGGKG